MAEQTDEESNCAINFSINPTMAEKTAKEAAQGDNAKRLAAKRESKKRKRAEESQEYKE